MKAEFTKKKSRYRRYKPIYLKTQNTKRRVIPVLRNATKNFLSYMISKQVQQWSIARHTQSSSNNPLSILSCEMWCIRWIMRRGKQCTKQFPYKTESAKLRRFEQQCHNRAKPSQPWMQRNRCFHGVNRAMGFRYMSCRAPEWLSEFSTSYLRLPETRERRIM